MALPLGIDARFHLRSGVSVSTVLVRGDAAEKANQAPSRRDLRDAPVGACVCELRGAKHGICAMCPAYLYLMGTSVPQRHSSISCFVESNL